MQISHNFCEFCITCPPKPRPMGHRHLFNVSGSWPCCAQLNGPVCHFPSWPCRPCRPTIARRAFNCHPCNRSAARWHLQRPNKRPNSRLSCPMSCAVPWPKLRSIKPLRTVGRVPTIWLKPGEVCAVSPKLRKVMNHAHNYGPRAITAAGNRWIRRHQRGRAARARARRCLDNRHVFNADSALPMLNQHCLALHLDAHSRRNQCGNHSPNVRITLVSPPGRVKPSRTSQLALNPVTP